MAPLPSEFRPSSSLLCSGQPTLEALREVIASGYSTVVCLRSLPEYDIAAFRDATEALGATYCSIPVASPRDITLEALQLFHDALSSAPGKVYIFCGSCDRVGAFLALRQYYYENKSVEEAIAYGQSSGLKNLTGVATSKMEEFRPVSL